MKTTPPTKDFDDYGSITGDEHLSKAQRKRQKKRARERARRDAAATTSNPNTRTSGTYDADKDPSVASAVDEDRSLALCDDISFEPSEKALDTDTDENSGSEVGKSTSGNDVPHALPRRRLVRKASHVHLRKFIKSDTIGPDTGHAINRDAGFPVRVSSLRAFPSCGFPTAAADTQQEVEPGRRREMYGVTEKQSQLAGKGKEDVKSMARIATAIRPVTHDLNMIELKKGRVIKREKVGTIQVFEEAKEGSKSTTGSLKKDE